MSPRKPKMGRPRLPKGKALDVMVAVKVSDEVGGRLDTLAERFGVPRTIVARRAMLLGLGLLEQKPERFIAPSKGKR